MEFGRDVWSISCLGQRALVSELKVEVGDANKAGHPQVSQCSKAFVLQLRISNVAQNFVQVGICDAGACVIPA